MNTAERLTAYYDFDEDVLGRVEKAAESMIQSSDYGQTAQNGVMVEPVTVVKRNLASLMKAFASTGKHQKAYIEQTGSAPYDQIWAQDSPAKFVSWAAGFLRLSNVAIAYALCDDSFMDRVKSVLRSNPETDVSIAWGTSSELTDDAAMIAVTDDLLTGFPGRTQRMRLEGMHHAGVDDIDLHAAIMLQGIKLTSAR